MIAKKRGVIHAQTIGFAIVALTILSGTSYAQGTPAPAKPETAPAKTAAAPAKTILPLAPKCARVISADVVAIDQPFFLNRLGASNPSGMVFALRRDVVPTNCYDAGGDCTSDPVALKNLQNNLAAGDAMLRREKRARPIVLRANVDDCLDIKFTNLLGPAPTNPPPSPAQLSSAQPATREASVRVMGMQLVKSIADDGSFVGANASSLADQGAAPGNTKTYRVYAEKEGNYMLYSQGADFGGHNGFSDGAQLTAGLFGSVNVEPKGSVWYRSQVTRDDLTVATSGHKNGQPLIKYDAVYPNGNKNAGVPVLQILNKNNEIVHTDLTAIVKPPKIVLPTNPNFSPNYAEPARTQPFREFTIHYHEVFDAVQAFPDFYASNTANVLGGGQDSFAINYGTGGIGAEIIANRIGVGPEGACTDCRFEEFFLSSWAAGEPATVVDKPANGPCTMSQLNNAFINGTGAPQPNPPCTVQGGTINGGVMQPLRKATKAFYPDDPSNVYHSYINDHVQFRVVHAGSGITHVHHLHAHQWLHTPNSDHSTYLDSQMINPGTSYTLDITYNGGGNRNKTVGDSIFHCHFYPHFAGGMWALWRTHDVFEEGTELDKNGVPVTGYNRALPDGEIPEGTPIPALVPLPGLAEAPMPAKVKIVPVDAPGLGFVAGYRSEMDPADLAANKNPGFPFFIPGVAGARVPQPPLDFAKQPDGTPLDGGLPRHVILTGMPHYPLPSGYTKLNFSKDVNNSNGYGLPPDGTKEEQIAMDFHSVCFHDSVTPEGLLGKFRTNGLKAIAGAPFADPALDPAFEDKDREQVCVNNHAHAVSSALTKVYKAADIQLDIVYNKEGWHYPQARIVTLWKDIVPTYKNERAPEPFFFRANSGDPIEYWLTNLVPEYYLVDDFQVRTPTDVIGQHIHLVKFDVTSSDGAANGFNYEDGSLSPDAVRAGIDSLNQCGGIASSLSAITPCGTAAGRTKLTAQAPPSEICSGPDCPKEWIGAQTNVQRWYADPLESLCLGKPCDDRTIRTVFTHDHFSPSTHQQTGLYAGLLVEPKGSLWFNSSTGEKLNTRKEDGGPTTWQANIVTANKADSYREFALEFQDFQLAYDVFSRQTADTDPSKGWSDPVRAINAPCQGALPTFPNTCATSTPGVISTGPVPYGTQSVNYRSEPLPFRLSQYPAAGYTPASPQAYDLSFVFSSTQTRNPYIAQDASPNNPGQGTGRIAVFDVNKQPVPNTAIQSAILPPSAGGTPWPQSPPCTLDLSKPCFRWPLALTAGLQPGDPYTPLLRAYENDKVQVRVLVGAHMLGHGFNFHGLKWLFEPSEKNSGYRDTQQMGISEHFEYLFTVPRTNSKAAVADYLYMPDSSTYMPGLLDGTWGIFRAYKGKENLLVALPNNEPPATGPAGSVPPVPTAPGTSCPTGQNVNKVFKVSAITSQQALASISSGNLVLNSRGNANGFYNQIQSKFALMYVNTDDLQTVNGISQLKPGVPVEPLILRANAGDCIELDLTNNMNPPSGAPNVFKLQQSIYGINLYTSQMAGLHPQLLSYDVTQNDGANVGINPTQTVAVGQTRKYFWYAGLLTTDGTGKVTGTPVEFGAINLLPSDPLEQDSFGLVGAMVIEPHGATWTVDANTRAAAVVKHGLLPHNVYREFVAVVEDTLQQISSATQPAPSGTHWQGAINYKAEPMDFRFGTTAFNVTDISAAFSDSLVQSFSQTPIFSAAAGTPIRFLLLHPAGNQQQIFTVHGHLWPEEPFTNNSTQLGLNPRSQWMGSRDQLGPNSMSNLLLGGAGGKFKVKGDYLYRTFPAGEVLRGLWGLIRVGSSGSDIVSIYKATQSSGDVVVQGINTVFVDDKVNAKNGKMAKVVTLHNGGAGGPVLGTQQVNPNGTWGFNLSGQPALTSVTVVSDLGGSKTVTLGAPKTLITPAPEEFNPDDPTNRFQRRAPQRPPVNPPARPPQ